MARKGKEGELARRATQEREKMMSEYTGDTEYDVGLCDIVVDVGLYCIITIQFHLTAR